MKKEIMTATIQESFYQKDFLRVSTPTYHITTSHTRAPTKQSKTGVVTPIDFDNFIPWLCQQLHIPENITVIRKQQEDYVPVETKRHSSTKLRIRKLKTTIDSNMSAKSSSSSSSSSIFDKKPIPITAYYNPKGELVGLAFFDYSSAIERKIIKAINICLPFHTTVQKLEVKGCLHETVLYEISKILPHSNITDVCLDDSVMPEAHYYILLKNASQLQNLSLRRCDIDDAACKMIADTLLHGEPASETLLVLNLASNKITDIGAEYLGKMLRTNRTILHLNISDNKITDTGAAYILNHLMLFSLTKEEVLGRNRKKLAFFYKTEETRKKIKEEISQQMQDEDKENNEYKKRSMVVKTEKSPDKREHNCSIANIDVDEFEKLFDNRNTKLINGEWHSTGNLRLCSLNLAYNNLEYFAVLKVCEVLKYQSNLRKTFRDNGLLRIILDGNNIPRTCTELEDIEALLELAISINEQNYRSTSVIKLGKKGARFKSKSRYGEREKIYDIDRPTVN